MALELASMILRLKQWLFEKLKGTVSGLEAFVDKIITSMMGTLMKLAT